MIRAILDPRELAEVVRDRLLERERRYERREEWPNPDKPLNHMHVLYFSGLAKSQALAWGDPYWGQPIKEHIPYRMARLGLYPGDPEELLVPTMDEMKDVGKTTPWLGSLLKFIGWKYGFEDIEYAAFPILMMQCCGANLNHDFALYMYAAVRLLNGIWEMDYSGADETTRCGVKAWDEENRTPYLELQRVALLDYTKRPPRIYAELPDAREGTVAFTVGHGECAIGLIPLAEAGIVKLGVDPSTNMVAFKLADDSTARTIYNMLKPYAHGCLWLSVVREAEGGGPAWLTYYENLLKRRWEKRPYAVMGYLAERGDWERGFLTYEVLRGWAEYLDPYLHCGAETTLYAVVPCRIGHDRFVEELDEILSLMPDDEKRVLFKRPEEKSVWEDVEFLALTFPKYVWEYAKLKHRRFLEVKAEVEDIVQSRRARGLGRGGSERIIRDVMVGAMQGYAWSMHYFRNWAYPYWPLVDVEMHYLQSYFIEYYGVGPGDWNKAYWDGRRMISRGDWGRYLRAEDLLSTLEPPRETPRPAPPLEFVYRPPWEELDPRRAEFVQRNLALYLQIERLKDEAGEYLKKFERYGPGALLEARRKVKEAMDIAMLLAERCRREGLDDEVEREEYLWLRDKLERIDKLIRELRGM